MVSYDGKTYKIYQIFLYLSIFFFKKLFFHKISLQKKRSFGAITG